MKHALMKRTPMKSAPILRSIPMRLPVILLCALALTGCSTISGWFGGGDDAASEPAPLTEFATSVGVIRLWSASAGGGEGHIGARQGPAIADGRVYAAAIEGGVRAFDLQTGAAIWHVPSDLRLSGSPGTGDGLVVVGSLDGAVLALDAATGAQRWRAEVSNEVIAAPAIGQGLVLVRSNDGRVSAFDAASGERRWFWVREMPSLTVRGNGAPVLGPGLVFVGNDDGSVAALALNDGQLLWEQAVAQQEGRTELERMADIDGSPALDGTTLYASSYKNQTMAVDAPSSRPLWVHENGGAGRIGVAADRIVVADNAGTVWALDKASGSALWQQPALARRNLSGVAVQGDYAVVGDFEGYLHWLRLDNGELAARTDTGGDALSAAPRVVNGILVAQNVAGQISAYRVGSEVGVGSGE